MGFGDFETICRKSALPLCSVVGPMNPISNSTTGIQAICYARSIELANTIIFEAATDFIHILALGMAAIMVLHVRSKFTAVGEKVGSGPCPPEYLLTCAVLNIGRKEITTFFYIYMALTMTSLILDAGVIPPGSGTFPYFVAVQNGFTSALCTCLLINGFVGFQLYEDGTRQSVWLLRGSSIGMFVISGAVSILTFKGKAGLGPTNTVGLFVVLYLINGICLLIYLAMQIILVTNTLQDRWPLGDISFGVFFFVIGQVILYVFSDTICNAVSHYLDGLFFATICNLLAVMMVYKYWDSITKEDLEFSVGTKHGNWEVKELLPEDDRRGTIYHDGPSEYASSTYPLRDSNYGG
ncbi:Chitin synthase, class 7 [Imshaugia aleurites]|uniref:Chitin synthase export chaperone n=1 Tax=Imshaugia aleurites TaxID=172621 RepID=A0A8H3J4C0_9LECA|nr:Chitin synthase, class 7 [Imshaugia aleurites]